MFVHRHLPLPVIGAKAKDPNQATGLHGWVRFQPWRGENGTGGTQKLLPGKGAEHLQGPLPVFQACGARFVSRGRPGGDRSDWAAIGLQPRRTNPSLQKRRAKRAVKACNPTDL